MPSEAGKGLLNPRQSKQGAVVGHGAEVVERGQCFVSRAFGSLKGWALCSLGRRAAAQTVQLPEGQELESTSLSLALYAFSCAFCFRYTY